MEPCLLQSTTFCSLQDLNDDNDGCLHGLAPRYLSDDIRRVADSNHRRLRSSSSALLTVRPTRLVTMGDRAFPPVAGSRLWNSLLHEVTSASTLPVFCSHLKTYLFQLSFPTN